MKCLLLSVRGDLVRSGTLIVFKREPHCQGAGFHSSGSIRWRGDDYPTFVQHVDMWENDARKPTDSGYSSAGQSRNRHGYGSA